MFNKLCNHLLRVTYVLKVTYSKGYIYVYTYDNYAARKILRKFGHPHYSVDSRKIFLTEKENNALMLFSKMRMYAVAKALGVSKAAASRLVKRAAAKVTTTYAELVTNVNNKYKHTHSNHYESGECCQERCRYMHAKYATA